MLKTTITLLAVACALVAGAQEPYPVGVEFQVNSYTTDNQLEPVIGPYGPQGFVIVWSSLGSADSDSDGWSIQGQRFVFNGDEVGSEFQVNTFTEFDQYRPAVSANGGGGFVVVWETANPDTSYFGLRGRSFASDGSAIGDDFQIHSNTTFIPENPQVAPDGGGGFVVVWHADGSTGSDSDGQAIHGRRFDSSGVPIGPSFQVNSYTTSDQDSPKVSSNGSGGFVVVWSSDGSNGSDTLYRSAQGQVYNSSGLPEGAEFQVNSYTTGSQWPTSVALLNSGKFVVVWHGTYGLRGQIFDASGLAFGAEFLIVTPNYPVELWSPKAIPTNDGGFVVGMSTNINHPPRPAFLGRRYRADGSQVGGSFSIQPSGPHSWEVSLMSLDNGNQFVGSWARAEVHWDLFGQVFELPDLFADGFESGDSSAWSSSQP